jgi:Ubiquitin elongating factor core
MKRTAKQVDCSDVSGDEFMINIMCVVRHLAEPVVQVERKTLEEADGTHPQSNRRINYEDETRLAADSNILKRLWANQRNTNAQESLSRSLEFAAREAESAATGPSSSSTSQVQLKFRWRIVS